MKKTISITKIISALLGVIIIIYAGIIFFTVKTQLNSGLIDFFENDTKQFAQTLTLETELMLDRLDKTLHFSKDALENEQKIAGEIPGWFNENVCKGFLTSSDAEGIVIYNKSGRQISPKGYGSSECPDLVAKALKGNKTSTFVKIGSQTYAFIAEPLYNGNDVFGVVTAKAKTANPNITPDTT